MDSARLQGAQENRPWSDEDWVYRRIRRMTQGKCSLQDWSKKDPYAAAEPETVLQRSIPTPRKNRDNKGDFYAYVWNSWICRKRQCTRGIVAWIREIGIPWLWFSRYFCSRRWKPRTCVQGKRPHRGSACNRRQTGWSAYRHRTHKMGNAWRAERRECTPAPICGWTFHIGP